MLMVIVTWSTFMSTSSSTWSGSARPLVEMQSLMSGISLAIAAKVACGLLPVVAGVAGAGDAEHRELRHLVGDRDHLAPGLVGRQLLRHDARPALVGAVVFAIAVVALDVAGGRDRDMHAGEIVMRLFGIAGMVLDPLPDGLVHVVGLGRRAAGGRRAAARRRPPASSRRSRSGCIRLSSEIVNGWLIVAIPVVRRRSAQGSCQIYPCVISMCYVEAGRC